MTSFYTRLSAFSVIVFIACFCVSAMDISYDERALTIDGDRRLIISGAIHYPRSTAEMWPDLIQKAKEGGLNAIETYVFWNAHEPNYRQYDFSGNRDLVKFIRTIQMEGMYAILRIGPYVCAEWNYGGLPVWLHNLKPDIKLRTTDPVFKSEMQTFTTLIVRKMMAENLFASQGGPIILAQIENEYGNVESHYGDAKDYINWCANMAQGFKIGIPWIMCQQQDAPQPMISTCNGYYCDGYTPRNNTPKIWTENWTGWYKDWGDRDPHRTAEDIAFAVARFFQRGGTIQNYYMYHGGTNFGRSAGGPFITTSYDYDAPLDEYGNLNQPKWGHLRQLHLLLRSMEKTLTYGYVEEIDTGFWWKSITIYHYDGKQTCFLGNANSEDITFDLFENQYIVPAWSVSILADCVTEAYNTAKVNSQTSIMVKEDDQEPYKLKWSWTQEQIEHLENIDINKSGVLVASQLMEQKAATNDTSDYLWYMTSVDIEEDQKATLKAHTKGHVLHAFVNGVHVGYDFRINNGFTLSKQVTLKKGKNTIYFLNVLVGLPNYGEYYDTRELGMDGPVQLVGVKQKNETINLDISSNKWIHKVGIQGEKLELYKENRGTNWMWRTSKIPTNKNFVWYKTKFSSPLGTDPVVVDLMGMGKGVAWVNGHNIGRFWPTTLAREDGCNSECDYRNAYHPSNCLTNCGKPAQRWYHVPRSFLRRDSNDNTLVLFKEFGVDPRRVKFQTVTVGKICANAYENNELELSCQGEQIISKVIFASFGEPKGKCGSFKRGRCEASQTKSIIKDACVGQKSCSFNVSEGTFGITGCHGITYRLAVEAICA